jgi:hypothetical protein
MVAAAEAGRGHRRLPYSNYGNRIDCYAWGEKIFSCFAQETIASPVNLYTDDPAQRECFSGTSGASAIITGAALLVQGVAENIVGSRICNVKMRRLLREIGTVSVDPEIGLMPNVYCIAANMLAMPEATKPDIYIRDSISDTGVEPQSVGVFISPDIIISPNNYSYSQAQQQFGEGSGLEDVLLEDISVQRGQDNYIYLRIQNRNCKSAECVRGRVYLAAPPALSPSAWNHIGDVNIDLVPGGNQIVVSEKITWPAEQIPDEGSFGLIAVIDHIDDPGPFISIQIDIGSLIQILSYFNNVAWRIFDE